MPACPGMTKLKRFALAAAVAVVLINGPAHAVRPDEMLSNPALEARAREYVARRAAPR